MCRQIIIFLFFLTALLPASLHGAQQDTEKPRALSLSHAVKQALANNLRLRLRQDDVRSAEGGLQSTEGKFDTLFSADAATGSTEQTPLYFGAAGEEKTTGINAALAKRFTTGTEMSLRWDNGRYRSDSTISLIDPAYNATFSLDISQPLLRGWGTDIQTAERETAQKQLKASVFLVDSQVANLAALVKYAYWDLVFAWQDIKVQQFSLTLADKLLEETRVMIEAGKLAKIEIYQPRSEVARREENLIAAERAVGVAEDELKYLLNSDDWLTPILPTDSPQTTPVQLDQTTIIHNALSSRPDIKAADMTFNAARLRTDIAKDNTRPSLNMVGSIGYGGTDTSYGDAMDRLFNDPEDRWQVGLNFSVPLQNSYAQGALTQAVAAKRKAQTNVSLLRLQVKKSVRTTVRDVHLAIKAMEATRKTTLATSKRLEAEQAKFEAGLATTLDVLIAQDAYSHALSQQNKTSIIYVKSLAEIDRIQGIVTLENDSSH